MKSRALLLAVVVLISSYVHAARGLQAPRSFPAGEHPSGVVVADFNQDGFLDILAVSRPGIGSPLTVNVLRGSANGAFQPPLASASSRDLTGVVSADFNGDGKLDIAVTDATFNSVAVLLGNGGGTFQTKVTQDVGSSANALVAGDFNGDGKTDVVVATAAGLLKVFTGVGDGTLNPPFTVSAGNLDPVAIASADFDADGKLDLVVALNANQWSTLRGNGDGTFQNPNTNFLFNTTNPRGVTVADLNRDGRPDLIFTTSDVRVLLATGPLTFGQPAPFGTQFSPTGVTAADMNGDGLLDVVVTNEFSNSISILRGNGLGGLLPAQHFAAGSFPHALAVADLNNDGKRDVIVANAGAGPDLGNLNLFLGNGDGSVRAGFNYDFTTAGTSSGGRQLVTADFNKDGITDIAVLDGVPRVTVLPGDGDYRFHVDNRVVPLQSFSLSLVAADFNNDNNIDLIAGGFGVLHVAFGNGNGTFQTPQVNNSLSSACPRLGEAIVAADFNLDGNLDLAVPCDTSTAIVLLGSGSGQFTQNAVLVTGNLPAAIAVGDLNHDGKLDLAVANFGNGATDSTVNFFLGNGNGTFVSGFQASVGVVPAAVAAIDLNSDGNDDLVVANSGNALPGSASVLISNGDGTFQPQVKFPIAAPVESLAVGDYNADGAPDFAVLAAGTVSLFTNDTHGAFGAAETFWGGAQAFFFTANDLTRGGAADLIVAVGTSVNVIPNFGGANVSFASSLNPSLLGDSVGFTFNIATSSPRSGVPTGAVTFSDGNTSLASVALQSGQASLTTSALQIGAHPISAFYAGDSNFYPRKLTVQQDVSGYDFSISNPVITLFPGQEATFLGSLVAHKYNFGVAMSCVAAGTPVPTTCSAPATVFPAQNPVSFSVTASDVTPQDFDFAIRGVGSDSHALQRQKQLRLRVVDFDLEAPFPASLTMVNGAAAQVNLRLRPRGSFGGVITLACDPASLPANSSCAFLPSATISASGGPVLFSVILTTTPATPTGAMFSPRVVATTTMNGTTRTKSQQFDVQVNAGSGTSDLAIIGLSHSADPTPVGTAVTFVATIQNGNASAGDVTLSAALPEGASSVVAPQGCVISGQSVTCSLGTMASEASTTVNLSFVVSFTRTVTAFASVASTASDPSTANNVATDTAQVRPRPFTRPGMPLRLP